MSIKDLGDIDFLKLPFNSQSYEASIEILGTTIGSDRVKFELLEKDNIIIGMLNLLGLNTVTAGGTDQINGRITLTNFPAKYIPYKIAENVTSAELGTFQIEYTNADQTDTSFLSCVLFYDYPNSKFYFQRSSVKQSGSMNVNNQFAAGSYDFKGAKVFSYFGAEYNPDN